MMSKLRLLLALLLGLALVGCPDYSSYPPTVSGVSGTISPWTRGSRVVSMNFNFTNTSVDILTGTMNTDGQFNVPLITPPDDFKGKLVFGPACSSSFVFSSSDIQFSLLSGFSVLTSTAIDAKRSGNLVQTNLLSSQINSAPKAGDKFVFYIYADQNGSLIGKCTNPNGPGSQTIDWKFRQGWNAILSENTTDVDYRLGTVSNSEIPADVQWQFIHASASNIAITNPITQLENGQSFALNAVVTEPDGTVVAGSELTWTSSDPAVLEVSQTGVVTAKSLETLNPNATVKVALKDAPATQQSLSINIYGFTTTGGTYNLGNDALGMALRLGFRPPQGSPNSSSVGYVISGPNGWNNDQPLKGVYTAFNPSNQPFGAEALGLLSEVPVVNGLYKIRMENPPALKLNNASQARDNLKYGVVLPRSPLNQQNNRPLKTNTVPRVIASDTSGVPFTIDTSKTLSQAAILTVTESTTDRIAVTWEFNPILDLGSQNNRLQIEVKDQTTNQIITPVTVVNIAMQPAFVYGTFDKTHTYEVRLIAIQGFRSGELIASRKSVIADFHPTVKLLQASGGAASGGYKLTIQGTNFDADTKVFFGTNESTSKTISSSSVMEVVVPAGVVGTVDVKLKNLQGESVVSENSKFHYFDIQESDAGFVQNLLPATDDSVYFIEGSGPNTPPVSLVKMNSSGTATRVTLPDLTGFSTVQDLTLDPAGNVWIAYFTFVGDPAAGNIKSSITRVTKTGVISTFPLAAGINPVQIAIGSDGNVWVAHSTLNNPYFGNITRIQPDGSNAVTFDLPSGFNSFQNYFSRSNDLRLGLDGKIWFTDKSDIGSIAPDGTITLDSNYPNMTSINIFAGSMWFGPDGPNTMLRIDGDGTKTQIKYTCGGSRLVRGGDSAFWCNYGGLQRSTVNGAVGTYANVMLPALDNYPGISDMVADTTGKIWYIRGWKIGILTP
jgi:streptogramin lyase